MQNRNYLIGAALAIVGGCLAAVIAAPAHAHGHHPHGTSVKHPAAPDSTRFTTSRDAASILPLPFEQDAFFFVVFGDRTGGPAEGIEVLAQAVHDTNLLEPDLVMTVGDLVQGYNTSEEWMPQMREYKGVMSDLLCPWFPVVGNHDIYWRGPGKPVGEHEAEYETHFGPLWYAFEHKNCWFIALYSDEGNPETGEKNFEKPECQRMSDEQFDWLKETLDRAADADHVFLFLHHPRWLKGNYGDDWDRVHDLLVEAGNVTAVFAGHIHRMRYDGPQDGIEYVTLATVGGAQSFAVPEAGYLHQFHIVTVRKDHIAMASVPVGQVQDVRAITGEVSDETLMLSRLRPLPEVPLKVNDDGSADQMVEVTITNPVSRSIEATVGLDSKDSRWGFLPDHHHKVIKPGQSHEFTFQVQRMPNSLDAAFRAADLTVQMDYLAEGFRYSVPESRVALPLKVDLKAPPEPAKESVLALDGVDDYLVVPSSGIEVPPDGPLTLECWFNANSYGDRVGLVTKTENSEYGIFLDKGQPAFYILIGDGYVQARSDQMKLDTARWHHVAGVFDGEETRLYVDGRLIAAVEKAGSRRTNRLPLLVGADVNGGANGVSFFDGQIDAVRLSKTARYIGGQFRPARRVKSDGDTILLLNMDGVVGPWAYDESPSRAHPTAAKGTPRIKPAH